MKIYYAHCICIYNTPQEERDLELLHKLFPNDIIYNPSQDEMADQGYKENGMNYFIDIVEQCSLLAFRGLPYSKIPTGVFEEISHAIDENIPIIELPSLVDREMSVNNTRQYLKELGTR